MIFEVTSGKPYDMAYFIAFSSRTLPLRQLAKENDQVHDLMVTWRGNLTPLVVWQDHPQPSASAKKKRSAFRNKKRKPSARRSVKQMRPVVDWTI